MVQPVTHMIPTDSIDLSRLERGLSLQGRPLGDGRYFVSGGRDDHWVDLRTPNHPRCDCGDHLWRDAVCKHILAALLREGAPEVIGAVGRLVQRLKGSQPPLAHAES